MSEHVIVLPEDGGKRVDAYLTELCPSRTRSFVQKLFAKGLVFINGKPAQKGERLNAGDILCWESLPIEPLNTVAQRIPLDILYEDEELLVVNKPAGMVVHPAAGNWGGTLVNALLAHCGDSLSGIGGVSRPGIVHRLDKDTSGLLIVAKTDDAHLFLSAQIKEHSFKRVYEAVVYGTPKEEKGEVRAPIGRHKTDRKKMCVTDKNSKEALTKYEILEQLKGFCHVKCTLFTGRTHQIRVHMSHIGHPVAGDVVYGPKKGISGLGGQLLHACILGFIHPLSKEYMEFSKKAPDYFWEFINKKR